MKHFVPLLILLTFCFSQTLLSQTNQVNNNSTDQQGSSPHLMALTLESGSAPSAKPDSTVSTPKMGQEEGILSNKKIRVINLGKIINWKGLDYAPTISADGKTLYYVSDRPGSIEDDNGLPSHDFWAAKKNDRLDTVFFQPYNIDTVTHLTLGDRGVNTPLNEGASSIAADGQTLYFTGCNRPDGFGSCDIYKTTIEGDHWGRPTNLGRNVNGKCWDSQPSIDPYQNRIYFTSNRDPNDPNGECSKKNFDIWYSDYDTDLEEWKPAVNLKAINTPKQEVSPFIAADGVTLFFASNGYPNTIGGLDFYVTRYNAETNSWSSPQNLGKPINTEDDEQFITLPASGDIIYFSSRRTDLPGYQGDFDIFMAFVPTFFRSVVLKVNVVDECSGENIPALVTIKNPVTGRTVKDSLTINRTELEMVISTSDYGNPKDKITTVNFEITAENPKYGKTMKVEKISKPPETTDESETKVFASEIKSVLTLGQRPVLGKIIDTAEYVTRTMKENPKIASFNGLVMEQRQTWDLYPLLNYIFFDAGSSTIPERYILFNNASEIAGFTDSTILGGVLDKYYHILNIYGYRLNKYPDVKIELVGCNDNNTPAEKKAGLSKDRVTEVFNYFKTVWNIDESRMKLTYRNLPVVVSNLKDSLGIVENRRVEILCNDWNVMKPVFDRDPKTLPEPDHMIWTMKNGIEDELVAKRRVEIRHGNQLWKTLTEIGILDKEYKWDWKDDNNKYPKDETNFTAQLIVTTKTGAECKSDPVVIPVMQVSTELKKVQRTKDSTYEKYNLILFPFDKFVAGPINERIMKEYVYDRCQSNSTIDVEGHTDVVGLYEHNQKLSENRAKAVYEGIMKVTKGQFGHLESRGVGEDSPLYNNDLPEERFYNRTVQVKIQTPINENEK